MKRQPIQVLVIPFRKHNDEYEYCLLNRSDSNYWQFIAGGAEANETPLEAARREANEEAGIPLGSEIISLDSISCVTANIFRDWRQWPKGTYIIREFAFAVEVISEPITLSNEHTERLWVSFDEAVKLLKWDSNKTALWELSARLNHL